MDGKRLTIGGGLAAFVAAFGLIFREAVGWLVGKFLDLLPLPKSAAGIVNWEAVPWLNTLAFALLALGVFLFWRGGRMRSARVTPPNPYPALAIDARAVSNNITTFRGTRPLFRDMLPAFLPIVHQGLALFLSFQKQGFSTPNFLTNDADGVAIGMEHYFTVIAPMLSAGHIDEAKSLSISLSEEAERRAASHRPEQWWTHNDW